MAGLIFLKVGRYACLPGGLLSAKLVLKRSQSYIGVENYVSFLPVNILTVWLLAPCAAQHTTMCLDSDKPVSMCMGGSYKLMVMFK